MGIQLSGGSKRSRRHKKFTPMTAINITPFVDVMLVLLVVFMITAPLLTVGVPVDLPKTKAGSLQSNDEPLTVSVKKDGKVYLQETEVAIDKLAAKVTAIAGANKDTKIYIRADQQLFYGKVMSVMGILSEAGFSKVALITELPK